MKTWRETRWRLAVGVMALAGTASGQTPSGIGQPMFAGTSWQLVRFQGDGRVVTPDDGSKYTLEFATDGSVTARIDCNRGRGTWKSSGRGQLAFGTLALTRALCPPGSMHDQIVKHWDSIRSYVIRNGTLFLSLMADGGIYEYRPARGAAPSFKPPVASRGPTTFICGSGNPLRATFYQTQPATVLLEQGGVTRPAFQVRAASGSRYEGDGVLFWEARGQATLNWMGVESICRPR